MGSLQIRVAFLLSTIFASAIAFIAFRGLRFRRDVNELLSSDECHGDRLVPVVEAVAAVNSRSSAYTFGVKRAARILFRGKRVWFVLGDVGSFSPGEFKQGGWSRWGSLYALADSQEQANWMNQNLDVFSPVAGDSTFPVFWVKLSAIMANQHLQPTPR
jgi:hypothetical protein